MKLVLTLFTLFPSLALAASRMPDINLREVVWLVLQVVGVALVLGILSYLVQKAPFIEDPWKKGIIWGLLVIGGLFAIYLILDFFRL